MATDYPRMTRVLPADIAGAFEELYLGIREAATNGTGYSPRAAHAMKALKPYMDDQMSTRMHGVGTVPITVTSSDGQP